MDNMEYSIQLTKFVSADEEHRRQSLLATSGILLIGRLISASYRC